MAATAAPAPAPVHEPARLHHRHLGVRPPDEVAPRHEDEVAGRHDDDRVRLGLVAVGTVLTLSTWFAGAAGLPGLRAEMALSPSAARGTVVAVQLGVAIAASAAAASGVVDRIPPRRLVVAGAIAAAIANAAPLVAPRPAVLLGGRLAVGAALALVYPPLLRAVATAAGTGRGRALGTMIGALALGSASPHLVNGLGGVGWRPVLVTTSVAAVLGAIACARAVPSTMRLSRTGRVTRAELVEVWRTPALRATCVGYVGHVWELYAGWAAAAPLMALLWGHTSGASLAAFAVVGLGALAAPLGGRLGDRVGARRAAVLAMVSSALLLGAVGATTGTPVLATALALAWGVAVIADGPCFPALVGAHAPTRLVGSTLALQLSLGFGATAVATWIVPAAVAAAGWAPALLLLVPGPLVGALALHRLGHRPPPPTTPGDPR